MVHGIVRQSRGFIRIESAAGEGTCVCIRLPLAEQAGEVTQRPQSAGKAREKVCTILLAEDEPAVRRFLTTQLSRQGYAVLGAENGRVGVELAEQFKGPIDLVVSDVLMLRVPPLLIQF